MARYAVAMAIEDPAEGFTVASDGSLPVFRVVGISAHTL